MKTVEVVGAVIYDSLERKFLATMRSKKKHMGGLWEFPGGKIEPYEKPEEALAREILEELNCTVAVDRILVDHTHEYSDITVRLLTYLCFILEGEPEAKEHEMLLWLPAKELLKLNWAEADLPTVDLLIKEFL